MNEFTHGESNLQVTLIVGFKLHHKFFASNEEISVNKLRKWTSFQWKIYVWNPPPLVGWGVVIQPLTPNCLNPLYKFFQTHHPISQAN